MELVSLMQKNSLQAAQRREKTKIERGGGVGGPGTGATFVDIKSMVLFTSLITVMLTMIESVYG
jgi:hypothetical protein